MKKCRKCGDVFPLDRFGSNGLGYKKSYCRLCDSRIRVERAKRGGESHSEKRRERYRKNRALHSEKNKARRADPKKRPKWVLWDARDSDRRRGRTNDLTLEFVMDCISRGCSYCGDRLLRISLDRIDNERGHFRDNVVPACMRCNYLRRDMPYEAWMAMVPTVKSIYKRGLFGSWMSESFYARKRRLTGKPAVLNTA